MPGSDLLDVQAQFLAISKRAEVVVRRVGHDLVVVRPRANAWSVGECLIHLQLTADAYLPIWRKACDEARALALVASRAPFTLDLWGRFFVWFLEPPPKLRFPAPRSFQPNRDRLGEVCVLSTFLASQDSVLKVIAEADGLPLDRMAIRSAFDPRLRYSLWSSFCANAAHHRRHLWQAERVADVLLK
jgi:hypothetical protein